MEQGLTAGTIFGGSADGLSALRGLKVRTRGFGDRLKEVRGAATQEDFARDLGLTLSTYSRYEREETPADVGLLWALQDKHGISADWLLNGKGPRQLQVGVREEAPAYGELAMIPVYSVNAKAGHGSLVTSEKIVDSLAFKRDFLRNSLGASPDDLYLIHVEGDSMEPTLRAGDLILVDRRRTNVDREGIYVMSMDDALLVKRLQRHPGGRIVASSDNASYHPFDVDLKARHDGLAIIGRVVWTGRRF